MSRSPTGVASNQEVRRARGFTEDDAHVALLVSHPALRHETVDRLVRTRQVAPTILRALGLDPAELQAVRREGTPVLPRLPFASRDR